MLRSLTILNENKANDSFPVRLFAYAVLVLDKRK